jgi:hypothetical protein
MSVSPGEFLVALLGAADGDFFVESRLPEGAGAPTTCFRGRDPEQINQFVQQQDARPLKTSIYYCTGTVRTGSPNRQKPNIAAVTSIFSDTDDKSHDLPTEQALAALQSGMAKPSFVVRTGHGYQPFWLLDQPYVLGEPTDQVAWIKRVHRIETLRKRLSNLVAGDPVQDITRMFRLPGTTNKKVDGAPVAAALVVYEPDRKYSIGQLEYWVSRQRILIPRKAGLADNKIRTRPDDPDDLVPMSGGEILPGLTDPALGKDFAAGELESVAAEISTLQGARHPVILRAAVRMGKMVRRGWITAGEVMAALLAAAQECGEIRDNGEVNSRKTIVGGIRFGQERPHGDLVLEQLAPLPESDQRAKLNGIVRVIAGAQPGDRSSSTSWGCARIAEMVKAEMLPRAFAMDLAAKAACRNGYSPVEAAQSVARVFRTYK